MKHRLAWIYKPIWHRVHSHNKMWSAVTCGEPGAGKSWLDLSMAEALDRSKVDENRFSIDRVYFSAAEFAMGMAQDYPKGTAHIFDDAGLNLFSREAMQQNVKDIAKIFQSIRYKNYIILLSLPAFGMLDKVVRQLVNVYIQPTKIDFELEQTEAKFQWLNINPAIGDKIYRHKPNVSVNETHEFLNYNLVEEKLFDSIWINRPSVELAEAYEAKKKKFMDLYYKKVAAKIIARAQDGAERKLSLFQVFYKVVKANFDTYKSDIFPEPLVDARKIMLLHSDCSRSTAIDVARKINSESGYVARGVKWVKASPTG